MKLIILTILILSISSCFAATDKKDVEDEGNTRIQRPIKEDHGMESLEVVQPAIKTSFSLHGKGTPIKNGLRFLEHSCSTISCFQSRIGEVRQLSKSRLCPYLEVYTSAIIHDLLYDTPVNPILLLSLEDFIKNQYDRPTFNYFTRDSRQVLPDDVDDTALCALALFRRGSINRETLEKIGNLILLNVNEDGIIQTYFPPRGERENRIDATICASAMRLLYQLRIDNDAKKTEDYMYQVLETKAYLQGAWFYNPPDAFLYYLSKAVVMSQQARKRFSNLLIENIRERLGSSDPTQVYPLDLSMRILAITTLGEVADNELLMKVLEEKKKLISLQKPDGSWPKDSLYKAGRSEDYFGGKEISTAFAVSALQAMQNWELKQVM